jgi:hypothetical protein
MKPLDLFEHGLDVLPLVEHRDRDQKPHAQLSFAERRDAFIVSVGR